MNDFNLDEVLRGTHQYQETYEQAMNGSNQRQSMGDADQQNEGNSLREAIRHTILDKDTKAFDKKRNVADLIRHHLTESGAFYQTSDGRLFFFSHKERRLY